MVTLLKLAAFVTVLGGVGAWVNTSASFSGNEHTASNEQVETQQSTKFSLDLSYQTKTSSQPIQARAISVQDYDDAEQGSFFVKQQNEQHYLLSPLLDTQVDMQVTGLVARTKLTQTFTNPSHDWVNGIYVFPLPQDAAVDQLRMQVGERIIVGEIHPKRKAKAIYQQAKNSGKKASLLEQQRTNMFTNKVANIGPGESITVTIEYQQLVDYQSGEFTLRFPMTVAPRYLPATPSSAEVDDTGWSVDQQNDTEGGNSEVIAATDTSRSSQNKVAINVELKPGFELEQVSSAFHNIHQTQSSDQIYSIELDTEAIANRDFVLNWSAARSLAPQAAHFSQQVGQEYYGLVMLTPPQLPPDQQHILPREVIFVLDTSGSMSGDSLYQAKTALFMAILGLNEQDTFNLIEFNSNARALWSYSRAASTSNKQSARTFIQGLEANGGTNMQPALEMALTQYQQQDEERVRQVVFVTDGSVGNDRELVNYIANNINHSRLFTVGIGAAPNSYFMREAAVMGKGTFTYIGSISAVKEKMETLFSKLESPAATNIIADFSAAVEAYPKKLPDLYLSEPVLISYRSEQPLQQLFVSGTTQDSAWTKSLALDAGANQTGLNVLWARRKIAQLTRERMISEDKDTLKQQIEQVAMKHHLVSQYTSLVAVDITPTALDISHDRTVKAHLPLNKRQGGQFVGHLPQTSTSGPLHLICGILFLGIAVCIRMHQKSR